MIFYSHSKEDETGNRIGSKTLEKHILGVLDKLVRAKHDNLNFGISNDSFFKLAETLVLFHDFGKFTTYFQNYLLKRGNIDGQLKQHARVGGIVAYNKLKLENHKVALVCMYLIFRHHTNLCDILRFSEVFNDNLHRIFKAQIEDICKHIDEVEKVLHQKGIDDSFFYPEEREVRRGYKIWAKKESGIGDYFLINYLFSLLIESDKLDASDTPQYIIKDIKDDCVDKRFGKPKVNKISDLKLTSNNELRNFCRAEVTSNLGRNDILEHHLFTLTAPTGIGKTMTALDFALKLKSKIKKEQGTDSRIIYALPFINIIEQALEEYETTLPVDVKVLGHYQLADVFGKDKSTPENGGEIKNYNQKLMALDTWQSDVVITSFVQFFETLIGNRNKLLKKFNHFANSIIILDEVQTLRLDQLPLIGATLFYLSKFLNSRIILMTATKPKIFELAQQEILSLEKVSVEAFELLKSHKQIFALFKRTRIISLLEIKPDDDIIQYFVNEVFSKKWKPDKSCILVCNTVKRSIELYNAISEYLSENGWNNPVEYLSTNIVPANRFERIEKLKRHLKNGRAPVLISTQVVEAGVDLDFDMGFRDLGPIDSIIQVAGRINRNNNPEKKYSPLYIFDFGDAGKIYGKITETQSRKALKSKIEIPEEEYLFLVDQYFDDISSRSSFSEFNKIFESMKKLKYDSEDEENERPVSSFKIIEESPLAVSVFVEIDEFAQKLRQKYYEKITGALSKEKFDEKYKTAFQQRIISVPRYLTDNLKQINEFEDNLLVVDLEFINDYYNNTTGFIRSFQPDEPVYML
jgi:CRISPR-associated endonuclease/helicase Cas3